jgi:glycerophosphoryl diester phosphodiesterase
MMKLTKRPARAYCQPCGICITSQPPFHRSSSLIREITQLKAQNANLKSPLVIAHRGASRAEPENTLRAFELAIRQGAQMIELDLQLTRDGHVIVLHDETLNRTTNLKGRADEMTLDEVRRANAGKGERVPSLRETLELARGKVRLYLEIKDARAGAETLRIVRAMNCCDEVLLASFNVELMKWIGDEVSDLELGVIIGHRTVDPQVRWREAFPWIALRSINYHVLSVWDEICFSVLITKIQKQRKHVYVWTVDSEEAYARFIARGVNGICTNVPDRLIAYLNKTTAEIQS